MGNKARRLLPVLAAAAMLLGTAGCGASGAGMNGENDRVIKVAVMDSTSVFTADDSYENGIIMAIEDLNTLYAAQGWEISYAFYDDGGTFRQGMEVLNEIVSDEKITAVVGTSSLNLLDVTADVLDKAGKLLVTYYSSSDQLFEQGYTHVFRNCYGEEDLGCAIAGFAAGRRDMERVAVYHSDTDYERGMVRAFLRQLQDTGVEIVDVVTTTPLDSELDAALLRWQELGVDTVLVSQYDSDDSFELLRRAREMDPEIHILGDFSFDYTDELEANSAVSDGIYITGPVPLEESREVEDFVARYRGRFGQEPTQWAIQLYDSIRMVVDTAVRIDSTDANDIAQALRSEDGCAGLGGTLRFDETGKLVGRTPRIMVSRDGKFSFLDGR